MTEKIVVTGIGLVNPLGNTVEEYSRNLFSKKSGINKISRFNIQNSNIKLAGTINKINLDRIPKRINHKIDTFVRYSLLASDQAIQNGNLNIKNEDPYKIGIFVGNNSGGWDISERGFNELYQKGAEFVNPWQATAWFPAAPQGFISIKNKIKGYSKSFVAGKCSGSMAIKFAYESLVNKFNDVVLCGGSEAPITQLATNCYSQLGSFYTGTSLSMVHSFSKESKGQILGEGSSFLILEKEKHAKMRDANILGEIVDVNCTKDNSNNGDRYIDCMLSILERNNLSLDDIDAFLPEGAGENTSDEIEANFINLLTKKTVITVPKMLYGSLYGASTATDIINALLFFKRHKIVGINLKYETINGIKLLSKNEVFNGRYILIANRSREGINTGILIKKYEGSNM